MKKHANYIFFVISFFFLIVTIDIKSSYLSNDVNCEGDLYVAEKDSFFDGNLQYFLNDNRGFARITGVISNSGDKKIISRVIYFTFQKIDNQYLLLSCDIEKTKTDNVSNANLTEVLPPFYALPKKRLALHIDKMKNGNLFYTSTLPSLYCRSK